MPPANVRLKIEKISIMTPAKFKSLYYDYKSLYLQFEVDIIQLSLQVKPKLVLRIHLL